ncbi:hypothetical protein APR47_43915 [Variovorax paradoxus]|nr:hypothetical protein APR47_43915 [Variovorax paradoxus]
MLRFGARKTRISAGRSKHYDGTFLHAFSCASYFALRQRFSPGVVSARGPWSSGSTRGGGGQFGEPLPESMSTRRSAAATCRALRAFSMTWKSGPAREGKAAPKVRALTRMRNDFFMMNSWN